MRSAMSKLAMLALLGLPFAAHAQQIDLAHQVRNVLPSANGGCGTASGCLPTTGGTATGPIQAPLVDSGGQVYNVLAAGAKCDGSTDDTSAINSALSAWAGKATVILPANKTCAVSATLSIPGNAVFNLNGSTLKLTGTGGGACGIGSNGLVQMFGAKSSIRNGALTSTGAAGCILNISTSGFNTADAADNLTITAIHANTTTCVYAANQALLDISNDSFYQCLPNAIYTTGTINEATIELNNFQQVGGSQTTPFVSVNGSTATLTFQKNVCEVAACISVIENNSTFGLRISDNWIGDGAAGTTDPYGISIMGTSGAIISGNYIQGPTNGIQLGSSSQTNFTTPYSANVVGNIIFGVSNGVVDYANASQITGNSIASWTGAGITENGFASLSGNYLVSDGTHTSSVILYSTVSTVGTNSYYAGSLSCPNGGNFVSDFGITPNSNCNGSSVSTTAVNAGSAFKIAGSTVLTAASSLPATCTAGASYTNPAPTSTTTVLAVCYPTNNWIWVSTTAASVPTYVLDAGAGSTGATAAVLSNSNDKHGWVQVYAGASPASASGIVTLTFGNSSFFSTTPKCWAMPANGAAATLSSVFVQQATTSTSQFVIALGSGALTSSTLYVWEYGCDQ